MGPGYSVPSRHGLNVKGVLLMHIALWRESAESHRGRHSRSARAFQGASLFGLSPMGPGSFVPVVYLKDRRVAVAVREIIVIVGARAQVKPGHRPVVGFAEGFDLEVNGDFHGVLLVV